LADGFIKLHRKLLSSPTFDNPNLLKVFIYCLLKASHCKHIQIVGLQNIPLLPGQFIYGRDKAGRELRMKPSTAHRYMLCLKSCGNVDIKANNKFSVVTVANWEVYQSVFENVDSNPDNKWTTNGQQMDTNNNVNNDNKNNTTRRKAPSVTFELTSKPYQCAKYLDDRICERLPEHQPVTEKQLQSWSAEFDKVNRLDKKSWRLIGETLEFSQEDDFWKKQILSAGNFRKHFEKMCAKMGGK
jgi:hypothetical protein